MPLTQSSVTVSGKWKLVKTNSPFDSTVQGPDDLTLTLTPSTSTYNEVYLTSSTLAAAADVTLDLYSFTDKAGTAVTATKLLALVVKVTGSGAVIKIEPGASNPITSWFSGTTPAISITPSTLGAVLALADGTHTVLSSTARNLKLSNTGAAEATYTVYALVGT